MSDSGNAVINEYMVVNQSITRPPAINVPVYVVGPSTLAQGLASIGINQSLIKPISIDQLPPELPSNSVVIIDWSLIRPGIINDPGGEATINLASPVIHGLTGAIIRGGDIVGIYANGSDERIVELILSYSWAVATNNTLRAYSSIAHPYTQNKDYLLAYPIIPVNMSEPVIIIVSPIKPVGLVIGPVHPKQLPTVITNMMGPTASPKVVDGVVDTVDPCYYEYEQLGSYSSPKPGIYTNGNGTFVWATPMLINAVSSSGIVAYTDGNGTYYWDTCLAMDNIAYAVNPRESNWYWLPAEVLGYEDYYESSTMYNNNGYVDSQLGAIDYYHGYQLFNEGVTNDLIGDPGDGLFGISSWNPPSTSSVTSYTVSVGVSLGIPTVSVGISLPTGTSESISGSESPPAATGIPGEPTVQVPNITWIFSIGYGANDKGFPNSFEDIAPANVFMPILSSQSAAAFNVDFENNVLTAQIPCAFDVFQTIWVDTTWDVVVVPQSSSTVSLSQSNLLLNNVNAPPNTYITGITSYITPNFCPP